MSQEATMIVVDNSDYMRNGDFLPTRLQAQNDAITLVCQAKRQSNPENTVGLMTLANTEVLCTLTTDVNRVFNRLHTVQPRGNINFVTSVRIAHLALRHRQTRNQKMRIVCFVASPIADDDKDLVRLSKRLKKEKVSVDVVNFGEDEINQSKLSLFVDTVNGKDSTSSHLVTVPAGAMLHDSLMTSPVIAGEDGSGALRGAGFGLDFGLDGAEDPDLLYALRVSMEDQRMRQEAEAGTAGATTQQSTLPNIGGSSEEALLQQALAMSMQQQLDTAVVGSSPSVGGGNAGGSGAGPTMMDFASMSEAEQLAYALQMSLQQAEEEEESRHKPVALKDQGSASSASAMEVDAGPTASSAVAEADEDEELDVVYDPAFLQSVLEALPGVDPQSEEVRAAMGSLIRPKPAGEKPKKEDEQGDEGKRGGKQ